MPRPKLGRPTFRLKLRQGIYQIEWSEGGKTRRQSTGSRESEAAEQFLVEFEATYNLPDEPSRKSIEAILDGYLDDRKGRVVDHARLVEAATAIKKQIGWMDADQIRPSVSRQYADRRNAQNGTIIKELGTLRAALNWAVRERWIDIAPAVEMPPKPDHKDRWLDEQECARLVDACITPHVRLFVVIALNTAARKRAIESLTWTQVDLEARRINFNQKGRARTKKGRAVVPINNTLLADLSEAYSVRTCKHVLEWNGKPAGNIKKAFGKAARRAGLIDVTPHVLRHTCATRMAMAGVPMEKIQKMLGHTNIAVTSGIYAHYHPDWLTDAADVLG